MNKTKSLFVIVIIAIVSIFIYNSNKETTFEQKQKEYAEYLANHKYSTRKSLSTEELKAIPKQDRPDLAFEQDFLKTMDPNTKKLHQERLVNALNYSKKVRKEVFSKKSANTNFNWESRGPKTVSGRVRAMMFDPNDETNNRVFAGGVSGGIWKNDDITDENSSWSMVNPSMSNFAISAIDFDPVQNKTFYVGTGEGFGNFDAVNGAGIWKTTDGGTTWNNLASTTNFEYVFDVIIRDEGGTAGVVYAIMQDTDGGEGSGIFRSTDGGVSWNRETSGAFRDLELASDNTIWVGGAFGTIFSSTDGTNYTQRYRSSLTSLGRVDLAVAQSNSSVVYALVTSNNGLGEVLKTTDSGANWTSLDEPSDAGDRGIPNDDFTRGQAWYDLIIQVNPTNENEVYAGGINLFKSLNGGTSWFKVSSWSLDIDNSVKFAHADQHNIIFQPNSNGIIFSTDGGIFYSPRSGDLPFGNLNARNLNFNITQFYSGAIDPIDPNGFIGGAQDNGTVYLFESGISNTTEILGGDGGFSFIDQTAVNSERGIYYIASTQRNNSYLYDFTNSNTNPRVITLVDNQNASFINPADYDDENNIFYSFNDNSSITRAKLKPDNEFQSSAIRDTIKVPFLFDVGVTNIKVSDYNQANRKVYLGTRDGRVVFINTIDDTSSALNTPSVVGSVSCLEFGSSEEEMLLTYSNYGVKSVWYTSDGGNNWTDVEGNLPDIPVRWSLFNPLDRQQVLLATEAGIWKTDNITAETVVWEPASSGMGNVRVDMLLYRASDNLVLAATHGRGMFVTKFTNNTASIEEVVTNQKSFTVYPTVSKGNFTVFSKNNSGKSKVHIFDISGRQVYKSDLDFNSNERQAISLNVNAGIYIVNLIDENGKQDSKKIIIE